MQLTGNNPKVEFTTQDVEIISKKTLFQGFFKIIQYRLRYRLFEGNWSEPIEREMFERGHAAAILPYDPITDQVVIVEQIRIGALEDQSPWQLEIVAGIVDAEESSEEVVRRESIEEAGINIGRVMKITSYYPSSGGCSEKLDLFIGEVNAAKAYGIHGLKYRGENIRVLVMNRKEAYHLVKEGSIENASSIIALQWLELNHFGLKSRWNNINK
ncbi:ADP-ribose pyrophosphatase [Candidatus Photodesmus blepharus]|uniref:ADP-ribose pyrophosphatase n=1 Tax=Candidatus Photodesmus blepharonis TaxID=1179155 RepID=A0A084CN32_9GAMM|nr:ADP-ribose diphosphatase [Candidatus Photodesmus blepharus]KEY91211.1 ADP-ribose pyrophosphatase [Candidatus Photodesmus blepharus]